MSATDEVRLVLETYRRQRIVQIVPWHSMKLTSWPEGRKPDEGGDNMDVHYFGQVAALNDCAYRSMSGSKFVLFTDMDEIVVPRDLSTSDKTWIAMLDQATRDWLAESGSNDRLFPGTYMIRNVFFGSTVKRPTVAMSDLLLRDSKLVKNSSTAVNSLTAVQRENYVYPYDIRSKYFVWSKTAVMIGIHFPYDVIDGSRVKTAYVNERVALLHHYQAGLTFDSPESQAKSSTDRWMADRYSANITRRIRTRCAILSSFVANSND